MGTVLAAGRFDEPSKVPKTADEVLDRFDHLRARTPRSTYLETLSSKGVQDELSNRGPLCEVGPVHRLPSIPMRPLV